MRCLHPFGNIYQPAHRDENTVLAVTECEGRSAARQAVDEGKYIRRHVHQGHPHKPSRLRSSTHAMYIPAAIFTPLLSQINPSPILPPHTNSQHLTSAVPQTRVSLLHSRTSPYPALAPPPNTTAQLVSNPVSPSTPRQKNRHSPDLLSPLVLTPSAHPVEGPGRDETKK